MKSIRTILIGWGKLTIIFHLTVLAACSSPEPATLENAQAALIQSEKMASLGQMTAGVAHEINNPINFISSSVQALKMDFSEIRNAIKKRGAENAQEEELFNEIDDLIHVIEKGASRTASIVKSLRTFNAGNDEKTRMVDIHSCLDSTISILNHKIQPTISLKKNYGNISQIKCHPGRLNQVFMNVIDNAIQATQDNGVIEISSHQQKEELVIAIKDTGTGMSPEVLSKIFDPFYTTKDVGQGTGLGMFISYGIIEEHNGKIDVKSQPNKGTEVTIYLPLL